VTPRDRFNNRLTTKEKSLGAVVEVDTSVDCWSVVGLLGFVCIILLQDILLIVGRTVSVYICVAVSIGLLRIDGDK
jgi:hypothetical protein